ncbi:MAG: hypothetical protein OEX08_02120 [Candidatus Nomurabacteria bacterium]|nr:hypothetical protein [Candidatus Nomurabacteria bacterium]
METLTDYEIKEILTSGVNTAALPVEIYKQIRAYYRRITLKYLVKNDLYFTPKELRSDLIKEDNAPAEKRNFKLTKNWKAGFELMMSLSRDLKHPS